MSQHANDNTPWSDLTGAQIRMLQWAHKPPGASDFEPEKDFTKLPAKPVETSNGKFQVDRSYATRSICNYDCIYSFEILARTEKTVTVAVDGKTVSRRVSTYVGTEQFKPFGSYSMAAVISATDRAMKLAETGNGEG
ncbi:MAG: hypothetical protein ACLPTZ_13580 [Beijerinckiaceae bacterium]